MSSHVPPPQEPSLVHSLPLFEHVPPHGTLPEQNSPSLLPPTQASLQLSSEVQLSPIELPEMQADPQLKGGHFFPASPPPMHTPGQLLSFEQGLLGLKPPSQHGRVSCACTSMGATTAATPKIMTTDIKKASFFMNPPLYTRIELW